MLADDDVTALLHKTSRGSSGNVVPAEIKSAAWAQYNPCFFPADVIQADQHTILNYLKADIDIEQTF
jgi:hypothetical protein